MTITPYILCTTQCLQYLHQHYQAMTSAMNKSSTFTTNYTVMAGIEQLKIHYEDNHKCRDASARYCQSTKWWSESKPYEGLDSTIILVSIATINTPPVSLSLSCAN